MILQCSEWEDPFQTTINIQNPPIRDELKEIIITPIITIVIYSNNYNNNNGSSNSNSDNNRYVPMELDQAETPRRNFYNNNKGNDKKFKGNCYKCGIVTD